MSFLPHDTAARTKPHILLVDDQPANLHMLATALSDCYQLTIATSGLQALERVENAPPDLILLDVMMPNMDGLETLKHLRHSARGRDVPVILVTADARAETQVQGLELGADDFLSKPVVIPVLQARVRNLLARKRAERQLRLAASVFSHADEGIIITDAQGVIEEVNAAFCRITGYVRDEVVGKNARLLQSGRQNRSFYAAMWQSLSQRGHWRGEIWNRRKSGEIYPEMLTISAVKDDHGQVAHYIGLFSDITAQKHYESQLEKIAHYDALTGLPNRVLLTERLHSAMVRAQRNGRGMAVVFIDLDGFKTINDVHGHEAGDRLLIVLAERMKQCLREGDTVGRLGGDEFVAVLNDLASVDESLPIVDRLMAALSQPVADGAAIFQVSASAGISFYPQDQEIDGEQLVRQADHAMYRAKLTGKNRYHLFDAWKDRVQRETYHQRERVRQALERGEFRLYYQPKVHLREGTVLGVEALLRWHHPEQGVITPAAFLPLLEGQPLMIEVGDWVLDTALAQAAAWGAAGVRLPVSINVDAVQFLAPEFLIKLEQALMRYPQLRAGDVELEILETSALQNVEHAAAILREAQKLGVMAALDDFGTGYSSLNYLKRLPVESLKIDQVFVRGMLDDPDDLAILEGIIGLSRAFRRRVIAEGIETEAHGRLLLQLGCEYGQGYAIAKPMPAEALMDWLRVWRPPEIWHAQRAIGAEQRALLFARVEVYAWSKKIESYLQGLTSELPPMDEAHCRFGTMLNKELAQILPSTVLSRIERLHEQLHRAAADWVASAQRSGERSIAVASAQRAAFQAACEALLQALEHLTTALS